MPRGPATCAGRRDPAARGRAPAASLGRILACLDCFGHMLDLPQHETLNVPLHRRSPFRSVSDSFARETRRRFVTDAGTPAASVLRCTEIVRETAEMKDVPVLN